MAQRLTPALATDAELAAHEADTTSIHGITDTAVLVTGPASATDNAIVRFDGTTGKLSQDSAVTITDVGAILAGDGTAALPAFAFASDPNTGMFRGGSDRVTFSAGGTARLSFAAGGQVELGGEGFQSVMVQPATASTVNYWDFAGSVTGASLAMFARGTDTDVNIGLSPKGAGRVTGLNVTATASAATITALITKGAVAQTDPLQKWVNSSDTPQASISAAGILNASAVTCGDADLSGSLAQDAYTSEDRLTLWMPLTEWTGTTAFDHGPHGHDGTGTNTTWVTGKAGYAAGFTSSPPTSISIPNTGNKIIPTDNQPFSVAFWVKSDVSDESWSMWVKSGTYEVTGFRLGRRSTQFGFWSTQNGGTFSTVGGTVVAGEWVHLAATYDGTAARLFINGSQVGSTSTGTFLNGTADIIVAELTGAVSDLRIYKRALSADEARLQYVSPGGGLAVSDKWRVLGTDLTARLTVDGDASTFTRTVATPATSTTRAGLRLPHGTAATTSIDGDVWTTTAGMFVRINGVTKTVTLT